MTKIQKILKEKNMSQSDLYDKIKLTCNNYLGRDVISKIVRGKKQNFELFTLLKICVALNVTPNDIIEKDDFIDTQLKR